MVVLHSSQRRQELPRASLVAAQYSFQWVAPLLSAKVSSVENRQITGHLQRARKIDLSNHDRFSKGRAAYWARVEEIWAHRHWASFARRPRSLQIQAWCRHRRATSSVRQQIWHSIHVSIPSSQAWDALNRTGKHRYRYAITMIETASCSAPNVSCSSRAASATIYIASRSMCSCPKICHPWESETVEIVPSAAIYPMTREKYQWS